MPQKLFITGATGFIGGSVLERIAGYDVEIAALVRTPSADFAARYPNVKIVRGSFDDAETIRAAAEAADIVIHAGDIDHAGCARAILEGLGRKTSPSFLLHLTGTGCISDRLEQTWRGLEGGRVWDDVEDIEDIYNLPAEALHHAIDVAIMDASDPIRTACICPPDIYGRAPKMMTTTYMLPEYVKNVHATQEAFYLGQGDNIRAVVHIDDVVALFEILLKEALAGGGQRAQWGREGFYFAAADEVRWRDVAGAVAALGVAQGWLPPGTTAVSWPAERIDALLPGPPPGLALYIWGSNSRVASARARALGWAPRAPSFWQTLPADVALALANLDAPMGKLLRMPEL